MSSLHFWTLTTATVSVLQPALNPQSSTSKGAATAPVNPAHAGEVPIVIGTADGDEVEPAHDPNNASRAPGNIDKILVNTIDNGKLAVGIFLGFQIPFDTDDHCILLDKYLCGIRGQAFDWFSSYVHNRQQLDN